MQPVQCPVERDFSPHVRLEADSALFEPVEVPQDIPRLRRNGVPEATLGAELAGRPSQRPECRVKQTKLVN